MIRRLLSTEFSHVVASTDSDRAVEDFDKHRPAILVLAANTLEKAERFYLGLYRRSNVIHSVPHKTVILCNKDDLTRVYELCKKRYFDDYVLFWPMTHDTPRLAMAVHHALWQLEADSGRLANGDVLAKAKCLVDLGAMLDRYSVQGNQSIEATKRLVQNTGIDIGGALEPVRSWVADLKSEFEPQVKAAAALRAFTDAVRPLVLVVDDDEFQLRLLAEVLSDMGLDVAGAHSGTQALAMMGKRRPDLIFMDLNLPDIDGIEVTRRIKAVERFAGIPVVMLTGRSEREIVVESLRAGVSAFVVKPFDRAVVLEKVSRYLDAVRVNRS